MISKMFIKSQFFILNLTQSLEILFSKIMSLFKLNQFVDNKFQYSENANDFSFFNILDVCE